MFEDSVGNLLGCLAQLFEHQGALHEAHPDANLPRVRLWSNDGWVYVLREACLPDGSGTQETVVAKYRVPVGWGEISGTGRLGPDGVWVDDSDAVVWEVER